MDKVTRSKSVPKNMQARYDQIVGLTDEFCQKHLNDEYRELAQAMAAALCRKRPSPVVSGPAALLGMWHHLCPWAGQFPI